MIKVKNNKFLGTGVFHEDLQRNYHPSLLRLLRDWASKVYEYSNFTEELYSDIRNYFEKYSNGFIPIELFTFEITISTKLYLANYIKNVGHSHYCLSSTFHFNMEDLQEEVVVQAEEPVTTKEIMNKILNINGKEYLSNDYCMLESELSKKNTTNISDKNITPHDLALSFLRKLAADKVIFNSKELIDEGILPLLVWVKSDSINIQFFYLKNN